MPTLKTFRRDAASGLGLLDVYQTTAEASGPDAARSVIVDSFAGLTAQTSFENAYVLPTTGAQLGLQRTVRSNGLIPAASALRVTWDWPAPLAEGTEVEILRLVPAVRELGRPGWRELLNEVLSDIPTIRRYPVTATDQTVRYAVPVWMDTEDQAIGIFGPGGGVGAPEIITSNLKEIRYDGETAEIELWSGYSPGSVFHLAVYQPVGTRVKSGGVWADSSLGLVDDDDEVQAPRRLVQAMAIERAARMELERPDARSKAMWQGVLARWTPVAAGLKRRLVPARPRPQMTLAGPGVSQWPKQLY